MEQERRPTTVLFADIHAFTPLAEQIGPERAAEVLELCLPAMAAVVERHGGYVDKTLGDGIMALFGTPVASSEHAAQAVRAGLALHRSIEALREDLIQRTGVELRLQVGIGSGTVVAGPMGPPGRQAYTAVGDPVNVASRLQDEARPGTVLVDDATHRQAAAAFRWGEEMPLRLRGKQHRVRAHRVLGLRARGDPATGQAEPIFVGRESEMAALREAWRSACRGSLRFVTLAGQTGVGTSRLASEFAGSLADEPLAQVLWAGFAEGALRLRDNWRSVDSASPEAFGDALEEALGRGPTLLIIEEPRAPVDAGFQRLAPLLRRLRHRSLMVLLLEGQYGRRLALRARRTSLRVEPLVERDATRLLDAVLPGAVSGPLRGLLLDRARGLPLFIVELARWLLETGEIEQRGGVWVSRGGDNAPNELPDSIQSVLLARIDRLDEPAKAVLRYCSVLGDVFSSDLLVSVMGPDATPEGELRRLEDAQLMRRTVAPGGQRQYEFANVLIRETVYQTLLRSTAVAAHRKAAEALQNHSGDEPESALAAAAQHFRMAGDDRQAARCYLLAAEAADRLQSASEAQQLRRMAGRLLGLASVWSLYGGGARPALGKRFLSAAIQFMLAIVLVLPAFAFAMSHGPSPSQVTLGLPSEVAVAGPSTVALPIIFGAFPFLVTGLLLAQLVTPTYLRTRISFSLQLSLILAGWLVALFAVLLALIALGFALRFDLLPTTQAYFSAVAILRVLGADLRFVGGILGVTLLLSLVTNGWLRWGAVQRRRQIFTKAADRGNVAWPLKGQVARQLGLVGFAAALVSALFVALYVAGWLPGLHGRGPAAQVPLAAVAAALAVMALVSLALLVWGGRDAAGRLSLGLEAPLVAALLVGALGAFAVRQEVVAISGGALGPGDLPTVDRMAELFPNLDSVAYIRGELHWFEGDESAALADFSRAIELDDSFPAAYAGRAIIFARLGAYKEAELDASRVVELRPEHPAGYATRAVARAALGQYELAAGDLRLATRPLPESAQGWDAYFMRCMALGEGGRLDEAIDDCRQSLQLNDRHAGTYEILGRLHYQAGRYREALEALDQMLRLVPDDALALANRAAVYRELGQYDEALEDLERSLSQEPGLDAAYRERALTNLALDRMAEAMADAEAAVTVNPAWAINLYVLGYVATYSGEYDLVIASMDRALGIRPEARFFNMRGYAYALKGDHQSAMADLTVALALDPSSPDVYDSRAIANLRAGRYQSALADVRKALELLGPTNTWSRAEFLYHRALVQESLGQGGAAMSTLLEASVIDSLPAVRRDIQSALARVGGRQ